MPLQHHLMGGLARGGEGRGRGSGFRGGGLNGEGVRICHIGEARKVVRGAGGKVKSRNVRELPCVLPSPAAHLPAQECHDPALQVRALLLNVQGTVAATVVLMLQKTQHTCRGGKQIQTPGDARVLYTFQPYPLRGCPLPPPSPPQPHESIQLTPVPWLSTCPLSSGAWGQFDSVLIARLSLHN